MFDRLVGINVIDEESYQKYRDEMTPILISMGGEFRYDLKVAEMLKSDSENTINRMFIISFPNEETHDQFFALEEYKAIKEKFFAPAVESATLIAQYDRPK